MWAPCFCHCWEHLTLITAEGSKCLGNGHARGTVLRGLTLHLYTKKQTEFSNAQEQHNCLCNCVITLNISKNKAAHLLIASFV